MGRKIPYGIVNKGHTLYFLENNGNGLIKAKATVKNVFNSEKLSKEESLELIIENKHALQFDSLLLKRFGGKRYLVLIEIENFQTISEFKIDRSDYSNMDD